MVLFLLWPYFCFSSCYCLLLFVLKVPYPVLRSPSEEFVSYVFVVFIWGDEFRIFLQHPLEYLPNVLGLEWWRKEAFLYLKRCFSLYLIFKIWIKFYAKLRWSISSPKSFVMLWIIYSIQTPLIRVWRTRHWDIYYW